jgi:hypothetical protein
MVCKTWTKVVEAMFPPAPPAVEQDVTSRHTAIRCNAGHDLMAKLNKSNQLMKTPF